MYSYSQNAEYHYQKRQQRKKQKLEERLENFFGVRKENPRPFFGVVPDVQEGKVREDIRKVVLMPTNEERSPSPVKAVKIRSVVFKAEDNVPSVKTSTPPVTPPQVHEYPGRRSGKRRYTRDDVAKILSEETGKEYRDCKKLVKKYKK